eukprot:TRINITY_DN16552_c0_g1_i1.p1 TRINITY_DN16552_c0_g1~~TRINITY_DN16552_c0_g1_i1.p1  ORF type:complete len:557 (+),score=125.35 TRINITY_DN16552_c0_g1_i1:67-1671(+)
MASNTENVLASARQLLGRSMFFDGVQIVNTALETYQGRLKAETEDLEILDPLEMLRSPALFLAKAIPKMGEVHKTDIAQLFAVRAELLAGLGATKRAFIDIAAAQQLFPDDENFAAIKTKIGTQPGDAGKRKTPTTIITGFLGAGKTTLLNCILQENHGMKVAVIENEFGEVSIDDKLLNTRTSSLTEENVIEMNNGCICCTVRGDLIAGLKKIHKQTTGKGKPLDAILIETTGLADPAPVAQTFFADDFVQANMALDGILTLVDAKHVLAHLREEKEDGVVNEAVEQVAFADRILLNKIDLVSSEELAEVSQELRVINKTAPIKETQNSQVDMDFILGISAFSLDKVLLQVNESFLDAEEEQGHSHGGHGEGHGHDGGHGAHGHESAENHEDHSAHAGHNAGHGSGHGHDGACTQEDCSDESHKTSKKPKHVHDYRVSSVGLTADCDMDKGKLDAFISWLMQTKGPDLYRSKGVLAVKGVAEKFVFQAVHMQFSGRNQEAWKDDEKRCCKMVFIGRKMDREELTKRFNECLVK